MQLSTIDWIIIGLFFGLTMLIGLYASKKAGQSSHDFFLSGRNMPWWLLGVSMVATTFSADTPNLVADIVRQNGVSGNWVWWAFLLTGMATVFVYARLWRRSGITTDLEFYELRYSGKEATFLRGFRAIYLGVIFNIIIMATVLLAGNKIAGVMLGLSPETTVLIVGIITVTYSTLGGLRGVILTDFFQFILSMIGMVAAAVYVLNLPEIGGLDGLLNHPNVTGSLSFFPDFNDPNVWVPLFLIPLAVQWWSVWYPGAEPGGGGYIAQRMLSAKNEKDAVKATLFFNAAHYALRPWPWILIALASLIMYPNLESLQAGFPGLDEKIIGHDLAFPAMLSFLPSGLLGLLIAALVAALMSTISTHLNWGSSYLVNDFYVRFIDKDASEKMQVATGRIFTIALMVLAGIVALFLKDALSSFNIILQIGAGTGLLFILRWFWWRVNAYSEIVAMIVSFIIAFYFETFYSGGLESYERMIIGVVVTTICWVLATLLTQPSNINTLTNFYKKIRPAGPGWNPVKSQVVADINLPPASNLGRQILMMILGVFMIYLALFSTGFFLYKRILPALACLAISLVLLAFLSVLFRQEFKSRV